MNPCKIPPKPDYDLLAVKYLACQDAGPRLRDLAYTVAEYRRNNEEPGRRSARKADLTAATNAARRLKSALNQIDLRTQVAALELGIAKRNGTSVEIVAAEAEPVVSEKPGAERQGRPVALARREIGRHSFQSDLGTLLRLKNILVTVAAGFGALADGEAIDAAGGRPERHDALLMGLEGLRGIWNQHRPDAPSQSQSQNATGFGAFAQEMFASEPVGFPVGTVRGAVADFLPRKENNTKKDV